MRLGNVKVALVFIIKEVFRNRLMVLLLFLIPTIFYLITIYTTSEAPVIIKIASVQDEPVTVVKQEDLGLIYIGLAATGLIASFIALNIMQRNTNAKKRLILSGYSTFELSLSKFIVVIGIVIITGIYIAAMGLLLIEPKHILGIVTGYILCGYVYGSYGLLVGAILKRELEGILFIVLLANLDIGWLQNPLFYAAAQNKPVIKLLPGFNPSQVSVTSGFSDFPVTTPILYSLLYGSIFLILAMIIFWLQMRVAKASKI
jgi:hypothetical protein